jgi:hypothetical protein
LQSTVSKLPTSLTRSIGFLLPNQFRRSAELDSLHDRDSKFCASFRATLHSGGIQPLLLPARSPNLNGFAGAKGAINPES